MLFREVGSAALGPVALPWPVWSSLDPWAALLALIAAAALFRLKLGVVPTLAFCAMLGFAARWVA